MAQCVLGHLYGIEKDLEKAIYWYNKAVENGNEIAQYNLGQCYELGNVVDKDETKAFELYKKSAESGCCKIAMFRLGYCYVNGIGTKIDIKNGFELYNKAAGKINNENDERLLNDLDKVSYWYKKTAENDNKVALYKLGELYETGKDIIKDESLAFEFYKQAAEKGYVNGEYKLGYCYNYGIGTVIDKRKAFDLFEIAAEKGNRDAQKSLVLLYECGKDTQNNIYIVNYWHKKVIKNGFQ